MRLHPVISKYQDLSRGRFHPTHMFVGQEVWDTLRVRPDAEWSVYPLELKFQDAVVMLRDNILPFAIHFMNGEYPHDPRSNAYVDFAESPTVGLEVLPHGN